MFWTFPFIEQAIALRIEVRLLPQEELCKGANLFQLVFAQSLQIFLEQSIFMQQSHPRHL